MQKLIITVIIIFYCLTSIVFAQTAKRYFPPLTGNQWDTISPQSLGWCVNELDSLLNYLEASNSRAFILLYDGKIVVEKYFKTFNADSFWYWASAGKTLTAATIGIAQKEGLLNIDSASSTYMGRGWTVCPAEKEKLITVRHQLTMTSGLDDNVSDEYCTLDTCLRYLADAGTRWAYHNAPYTLLDSVIEKATGTTLNSYFGQKIRTKIGMNGNFLSVGYNNVYFSNARSMARFGLLILNKGIWENDTILADSVYYNQMITSSQSLNQSYGYLWWLNGQPSYMVPGLQIRFNGSLNPDAPADMFAGLGKNGQLLNIVPSKNLVLIRMGDVPDTGGEVSINFNNEIWKYLNRVMCKTTVTDKKISTGTGISAYPNPVSGDMIYLTNMLSHVTAYNPAGQTVWEGDGVNAISVNDWNAGTYMLKGFDAEGNFWKQLILKY